MPEEGSEARCFNIKDNRLSRVHVRVPALKGLMSRVTQFPVHLRHYKVSLDGLFSRSRQPLDSPRNSAHFFGIIGFIAGRDSSVGIATHYGLDGPGIESRRGARFFRTRLDRTCGLTQPPIQWVTDLVLQGKAAGAWR